MGRTDRIRLLEAKRDLAQMELDAEIAKGFSGSKAVHVHMRCPLLDASPKDLEALGRMLLEAINSRRRGTPPSSPQGGHSPSL